MQRPARGDRERAAADWEFGGDLEVILANTRKELSRHKLGKLLPHPFDDRNLL